MPKYKLPYKMPVRQRFGAGGGPPPSIGLQKYHLGMEREQMEFAAGLETEQTKELMGHKYKIEQRGALQARAHEAAGGKYGAAYWMRHLPHEESQSFYHDLMGKIESGEYEFAEDTSKRAWKKLQDDWVSVRTDRSLDPAEEEDALEQIREQMRSTMMLARPTQARRDTMWEAEKAQISRVREAGGQIDPKTGMVVLSGKDPEEIHKEQREQAKWASEQVGLRGDRMTIAGKYAQQDWEKQEGEGPVPWERVEAYYERLYGQKPGQAALAAEEPAVSPLTPPPPTTPEQKRAFATAERNLAGAPTAVQTEEEEEESEFFEELRRKAKQGDQAAREYLESFQK